MRACARKPEAYVVVAVVRVVVVAICNPTVVGIVVPIAAPFDTVGTGPLRIPYLTNNAPFC